MMRADDQSMGTPESRFRLLLRIASGGMGTVYLAQQRGAAGFQRLVAVKRAHPHLLEDPTVARMFTLEAQLSSLLRHPNLVGVIDVEDSDGELLLVMEYVEGASLAEVQREQKAIALPLALRIILDVSEGLEALHQANDEDGHELGLVHRDVSPQNILVGIDGVARLADLGIARSRVRQGTVSLVRGKPSYMAPEYLMTGKATPASDVFALGVIAWETLTGRRLYEDEELDARARVRVPVVRPSKFVPSIPSAIDDVCLRAVAADPEARFPSALTFAAALEGAARAVPPKNAAISARTEVGALVTKLFGAKLHARREILREVTPVDLRTWIADPVDARTLPTVSVRSDDAGRSGKAAFDQDGELAPSSFGRTPRRVISMDRVAMMPLAPAHAFVLSLVDGNVTVETVLDMTGLPRHIGLDALRALETWGIIALP